MLQEKLEKLTKSKAELSSPEEEDDTEELRGSRAHRGNCTPEDAQTDAVEGRGGALAAARRKWRVRLREGSGSFPESAIA